MVRIAGGILLAVFLLLTMAWWLPLLIPIAIVAGIIGAFVILVGVLLKLIAGDV